MLSTCPFQSLAATIQGLINVLNKECIECVRRDLDDDEEGLSFRENKNMYLKP